MVARSPLSYDSIRKASQSWFFVLLLCLAASLVILLLSHNLDHHQKIPLKDTSSSPAVCLLAVPEDLNLWDRIGWPWHPPALGFSWAVCEGLPCKEHSVCSRILCDQPCPPIFLKKVQRETFMSFNNLEQVKQHREVAEKMYKGIPASTSAAISGTVQ